MLLLQCSLPSWLVWFMYHIALEFHGSKFLQLVIFVGINVANSWSRYHTHSVGIYSAEYFYPTRCLQQSAGSKVRGMSSIWKWIVRMLKWGSEMQCLTTIHSTTLVLMLLHTVVPHEEGLLSIYTLAALHARSWSTETGPACCCVCMLMCINTVLKNFDPL